LQIAKIVAVEREFVIAAVLVGATEFELNVERTVAVNGPAQGQPSRQLGAVKPHYIRDVEVAQQQIGKAQLRRQFALARGLAFHG